MNDPKIANVTPLDDTHRLYVVWDDGTENVVDLWPSIERFKVLAPIKDLKYFRKVVILEDGWMLGWPGNIDYAADNLWERAREQRLQRTG